MRRRSAATSSGTAHRNTPIADTPRSGRTVRRRDRIPRPRILRRAATLRLATIPRRVVIRRRGAATPLLAATRLLVVTPRPVAAILLQAAAILVEAVAIGAAEVRVEAAPHGDVTKSLLNLNQEKAHPLPGMGFLFAHLLMRDACHRRNPTA